MACIMLNNFEANVMGFSKQMNEQMIIEICYYKKIKNVYGDILNYNYLKKLSISTPNNLSLATQSLVSVSYNKPRETIITNTLEQIF